MRLSYIILLKQDAKTTRVTRLGELFMRLILSAVTEATYAMTTCTSPTCADTV